MSDTSSAISLLGPLWVDLFRSSGPRRPRAVLLEFEFVGMVG